MHEEKSKNTRNQTQTKMNFAKRLKTNLNDVKKYFSTYQGFKMNIVILKPFANTGMS